GAANPRAGGRGLGGRGGASGAGAGPGPGRRGAQERTGGEARRGEARPGRGPYPGPGPGRRHDPQPVPDQRVGGHLPGKALEERRQPLRLRLLLRGAGEGLGGGERAAGDPHAAPLPAQRLPPQDLLRGRHPERGAAPLRHRVPAPRRRHLPGSTNVGDQLPTGQLSVVPWRRTGVKYTNNEAYFDVIEEIDAIIDKSGSTITAEIQGVIDACVKLTGMPDLTLSFMNPRLLDDVSFHPCVRFKRWESERILSFIPPDGNFRLLSYHVSAQNLVAIPVYVKHNISFRDSSSLGRFEITVGPKQTMGKTIEGVMVTSQMPKGVLNMSLTPSQGTHIFDPVTKLLSWDVGKINPQKLPSLKGSMNLQAGTSKPDENPTINLQFKIQQLAISGLKVNRLDMYGEKYKPFKGIKYMTKAGKFQVRT
uniref:Inhibitor of nuclear factor kappa B kinase subunit beta n=1 Tax=Anser brachyrhynchus TaxID=132585 RepID=A0A8B9I047_9AVES